MDKFILKKRKRDDTTKSIYDIDSGDDTEPNNDIDSGDDTKPKYIGPMYSCTAVYGFKSPET